MRWLLIAWFAPVTFLAAWLWLAPLDFGYVLFSRQTYDQTFGLYAGVLGVPAETLPPLVVRALMLDSAIVLGLYALRRRRAIIAALRRWNDARGQSSKAVARLDSLSSAP